MPPEQCESGHTRPGRAVCPRCGVVVADGEERSKTMEPEDALTEKWSARSTGPRNVDIGLWDWTETSGSVLTI